LNALSPLSALSAEGPGDAETIARLREGESIGRPIGSAAFLTRIETLTARPLRARKRGPKPAQDA
jgi:hypothetical protein